jgi:aldehyde dehydrogenase (NAD+)
VKLDHDQLFIAGEWVAPTSAEAVEIVNPATEQVIGRVPVVDPLDIDRAVDAAIKSVASVEWSSRRPDERAAVVAGIADGVEARLPEFAEVVSLEMGSPIAMSTASQQGAADMVRTYIQALSEVAFESIVRGPRSDALLVREPVGVVAAISPWNGPLFLTLAKLVPALLAGCSVVAKPAVETPLDAYLLAEVLADLDLPPGVVSVLPAGRVAGQHLVENGDVDKVSFTGSTATGAVIAATCAPTFTRYSLELGGKSAAILLDDADLGVVVSSLSVGSFYNTGQACNALTRLLVPNTRYDEVLDAVVSAASNLVVGDPLDPTTQIGPLAFQSHYERVMRYIQLGLDDGARLVRGGGRPAGFATGFYIEPTVFADVTNDMRIAQEEIFGPVLSVIRYDGGEEEAIRIANDSRFGLHGAVFSSDTSRALSVARRLQTGMVSINGYMTNTSAPFGGVKGSGVGREFGTFGIEEYLEWKTINMAQSILGR